MLSGLKCTAGNETILLPYTQNKIKSYQEKRRRKKWKHWPRNKKTLI